MSGLDKSSKADVLKAQQRLTALGYDPGPADGVFGAKTLKAVQALEAKEHLPLSKGEVPEITLAFLYADPVWLRGLDVAKYQSRPDWLRVKAAGISFVIAKATESASYVDSSFVYNWKGLRDAGIVRGAYLFWHPDQDPLAQARHFAKTVGPLQKGDLPPTIDVERNDRLSAAEVNKRLQAILDEVEALMGAVPIIYTSRRVCLEQGISVGGKSPVWLAYYRRSQPPIPDQWAATGWRIWQPGYASGLDGVQGDCDRNFHQGSLADLQALCVK